MGNLKNCTISSISILEMIIYLFGRLHQRRMTDFLIKKLLIFTWVFPYYRGTDLIFAL